MKCIKSQTDSHWVQRQVERPTEGVGNGEKACVSRQDIVSGEVLGRKGIPRVVILNPAVLPWSFFCDILSRRSGRKSNQVGRQIRATTCQAGESQRTSRVFGEASPDHEKAE